MALARDKPQPYHQPEQQAGESKRHGDTFSSGPVQILIMGILLRNGQSSQLIINFNEIFSEVLITHPPEWGSLNIKKSKLLDFCACCVFNSTCAYPPTIQWVFEYKGIDRLQASQERKPNNQWPDPPQA